MSGDTKKSEGKSQESAPEVEKTSAEQPANETPPVEEKPFAIFKTADDFKKRMDQAVRSNLRESLGLESMDELKSMLETAKAAKAEQEEARKKQLTETERLKEELAAVTKAKADAESKATAAAFEAHATRLFSKHGIKNEKYAMFLINEAMSKDDFDEDAFIAEITGDDQKKAALGIATEKKAEAAPEAKKKPANTAPADAPKPGGDAVIDASKMTDAEFLAYRRSRNI